VQQWRDRAAAPDSAPSADSAAVAGPVPTTDPTPADSTPSDSTAH
jgi:hypothetical protein